MPATPKFEGLTGLRGLAALAVFGVHFNQTVHLDAALGPFELERLLANGEHGVSLFFSLSGFLLSLPFWRAINRGGERPNLRVYAVRRLARILPAYYVALTALIVASGMWRYPPTYPDIALHYTFLFNLTEFSIFSINPPFWTLAVEMQFYALLPLLFVLLRRAGQSWRPWIVLAAAVVAYVLHYGLISGITHVIDWPLDPRFAWIRPYGAVLSHSLFAHLPHFLLGVVAATLFLRWQDPGRSGPVWLIHVNEIGFWSALTLVLVFTSTGMEDAIRIPYGRYGLPLLPLLLTTMIVTTPGSRLARRLLDTAPLRALGAISYGFYIYHLPCLNLVDRYMAGKGWDAAEHGSAFALASLVLTILVATASFAVIERPVLKIVRRFTATRRTGTNSGSGSPGPRSIDH